MPFVFPSRLISASDKTGNAELASFHSNAVCCFARIHTTRMWANAQADGRPAEHRWRPLFNAANFS